MKKYIYFVFAEITEAMVQMNVSVFLYITSDWYG